jgi:type I restriction enzyme S subunit
MNNSYSYIKLKELCDVNQGLQIPIESRFTENAPNRYFYITVQFLKASHTNKFYVENPPSSSICNEEDILIVRTGSTGQIVTGVKGCFHNNFFKVNFNKELIHGRYLYHCLNTKEKYRDMLRRAGVTTIPDLNHFMFLDMEIPVPKKQNQIEIAKTLDTLDSKIELNNRINAELEAMAKTLYDYWFVQFDFPNNKGKPYKTSGGKMVWNDELKREIPEGWQVKTLISLCDRIGDGIHGTPKYVDESDYFFINGNNLSNGFINTSKETKNVSLEEYEKYFIELNVGTILLSINGTLGNLAIYTDEKVMLGKSAAFINCKKNYRPFCYQYLKSDSIQNKFWNVATGSTIKNLSLDSIKNLLLLFPGDVLINKYFDLAMPIEDKRKNIFKENQKLTELRDWLLPMLMNGQVVVS